MAAPSASPSPSGTLRQAREQDVDWIAPAELVTGFTPVVDQAGVSNGFGRGDGANATVGGQGRPLCTELLDQVHLAFEPDTGSDVQLSTGVVMSTAQSPRHSRLSRASRPPGFPEAARRSST